MQRARLLLATTLLLTVVAGISHYTLGKAAGAYVSALPLVLVAPIIAIGCDSLRGRLSASMLGIVQSAFGNIAEFALTLLALSANLPDVVRVAIAGSILGNALLLGGIAGLIPTIRERGRNLTSLKFERHLFSSIATLAVVAVVPIGILSFGTGNELGGKAREDISLAAGVGLLLIGAL
ncbi:MAG: Ca2+:H+ antiporter, partial [Gaiellales bacterium]|nr:Ca2+:H+ antiporter [Gaiellales bacterium]